MPLPDTREDTLKEINRLEEWTGEMREMLDTDGTVPFSMRPVYETQLTSAKYRLSVLKDTADRHGWNGYLND